jgi:hypothetical protein
VNVWRKKVDVGRERRGVSALERLNFENSHFCLLWAGTNGEGERTPRRCRHGHCPPLLETYNSTTEVHSYKRT